MTALSTRDALAKALPQIVDAAAARTAEEGGYFEDNLLDALLASDTVIDAATLADDEALVERLTLATHGEEGAARQPRFKRFRTRLTLRALAAALTERGAQ